MTEPSRSSTRLAAWLAASALVAGCQAARSGQAPPAQPPAQTPAPSQPQPASSAADQAVAQTGLQIYARECAVCHGDRGQGQPNWQVPLSDGTLPAPPHDPTGHTWHHPDGLLKEIILRGGGIFMPNSAMPGYADRLTPGEVDAVIAAMKTWWGPDELAFQAEQNASWDPSAFPWPNATQTAPAD